MENLTIDQMIEIKSLFGKIARGKPGLTSKELENMVHLLGFPPPERSEAPKPSGGLISFPECAEYIAKLTFKLMEDWEGMNNELANMDIADSEGMVQVSQLRGLLSKSNRKISDKDLLAILSKVNVEDGKFSWKEFLNSIRPEGTYNLDNYVI